MIDVGSYDAPSFEVVQGEDKKHQFSINYRFKILKFYTILNLIIDNTVYNFERLVV
jgi:hypothetical protein